MTEERQPPTPTVRTVDAVLASVDQLSAELREQRIQLTLQIILAGCVLGMLWELRREVHKAVPR